MNFVKQLESFCERPIHTIDIGGGLSTDFDEAPEPEEFSYRIYRKELEQAAPGNSNDSVFSNFLMTNVLHTELFSGRYHVVTEMGASLIQKAGKTLTRY